MPFGKHGNQSFMMTSVEKNAPHALGVHGLSNTRQWVDVGETADIPGDLLSHLPEPHIFLRKHPPSGFTWERTTPGRCIGRQIQLVLELKPSGNRLVRKLSKNTTFPERVHRNGND